MPGFKITDRQRLDEGQVPLPKDLIYIYTWDMSLLAGEQVDEALVYLRECTLPSFEVSTEDVATGHAEYNFAKSIQWRDVSLSFYDTNGLLPRLQELYEGVWNPNEGIRHANSYMAETLINVYFLDNTLAYSWRLINSWIKSLKYSNLTYENSGILNIDIVLSYTWAESEQVEQ